MPFKLFSRNKTRDKDYDFEHYEEDASFKMEKSELFEAIKTGKKKRLSTTDYLTPEDFLETDEDGLTLLEIVYKYGANIDDSLEERIINDNDIVEFCLKHPKVFTKLIVEKLSYDYRMKRTIHNNTLFKVYSNGLSLMEYIIKNNYLGLYVINGVDDIRVYDLLIKYGRYDSLSYLNENLLFSPYSKFSTLFEQLLSENRVTPDMIKNFRVHTEACELCRKYNKMYLLKHATESFLFYEFKDGTKVINYLIKGNNADKETFFHIGKNNEQNMIFTIIKYKAYRYLVYYPNVLFTTTPEDKNKTYLDLLLDNYNESYDLYLAEISADKLPMYQRAEIYIKCAKRGLVEFLPRLEEESLLTKTNNISLLDALLKTDRETTISKVLPPRLLKKPSIAAILNTTGIKIKDANVPTDREDEYLETKNKMLELKVPKDLEQKIKELSMLFLSDNVSTMEEINTLIASYRQLASNGYKYIYRELDMLTRYKRAYPGFTLIRTTKSAYYSSGNNSINVTDSSIGVFNHELGHALHHIGANSFAPKNLEEVLSRIRNDRKTIDRIKEFSKKMEEVEKVANKEAEKIYERKYGNYFNKNRREKIRALISKERDSILKSFTELGYDSERIKASIAELYDISEEEYIERFRKTRIKEISCDIIGERFHQYEAVSDILDAIYVGRFRSNMFITDSGEKISLRFGHGINYYYKEGSIFNEMMADYSEIIKSSDAPECLAYLRSIVGDELVNLLETFYERKVLHIETLDLSKKESVAHGR